MKNFVLPIVATLSIQFPVLAQPFKYTTPCYLEVGSTYLDDVCTVVETREKGGALKSRNIFSNKFALTIKSKFDGQKNTTWDSFNKFEYNWEYKTGYIKGTTATYVMPGILLEEVSWD